LLAINLAHRSPLMMVTFNINQTMLSFSNISSPHIVCDAKKNSQQRPVLSAKKNSTFCISQKKNNDFKDLKDSETKLQRSNVLRAGLLGTLAQTSAFGLMMDAGSPKTAFAVGGNLSFQEAEDRIQQLERKLRGLYREEDIVKDQLSDMMVARAVAAAEQVGPRPIAPGVLELFPGTWDEAIGQNRQTFVEFYAPWCPYCKRLEPIWSDLAEEMKKSKSTVQIARLNADKYADFMPRYDVSGFPTLILFQRGRPTNLYKGGVDLDSLKNFIFGAEMKA